MKDACQSLAAKKPFQISGDSLENSLQSKINIELPEYSSELKKLKTLLSLYNSYKRDLKEFGKQEQLLHQTKAIIPPVVQKSFWSTKVVSDPTSIIDQFSLNLNSEMQFLELVMKRIQEIEQSCM